MDCILTYSEQSLCAKPTGECSRFHHTLNREERRAESSYPVISLKCLWGGGHRRGKGEGEEGGSSDTEGCHLKL